MGVTGCVGNKNRSDVFSVGCKFFQLFRPARFQSQRIFLDLSRVFLHTRLAPHHKGSARPPSPVDSPRLPPLELGGGGGAATTRLPPVSACSLVSSV